MNATAAPAHIARDTYDGRWTIRSNSHRSDTFTAAELAAWGTTREDGASVFWEYAGQVRGQALYVRTRFVAEADGSLVGYDADGARKVIHPADRRLRILTR